MVYLGDEINEVAMVLAPNGTGIWENIHNVIVDSCSHLLRGGVGGERRRL